MTLLRFYLTIFLFIISITVGYFFFSHMETLSAQNKKSQDHLTAQNRVTPSLSPTVTITPTPIKSGPTPTVVKSQYMVHKNIFATMFWVGEKATSENDYIPNHSSAWDSHWLESYGGIDNPYTRNGYHPKDFVPKENPFYFALPYNDLDKAGRKANSYQIPWYSPNIPADNFSLVKNRWVKLTYKNEVCYAQWEDVGPFQEDDFEYVFFGKKQTDKRAGIDLSPAARTCLKMVTNGYIDWQFVDDIDVPEGPWKKIVTTSQVNWY